MGESLIADYLLGRLFSQAIVSQSAIAQHYSADALAFPMSQLSRTHRTVLKTGDVICLCPFAHSFIIHGLLSGFKRPSQQRKYPNKAQAILLD
jgi:hypothetical protein